jgi:hypothetical protein
MRYLVFIIITLLFKINYSYSLDNKTIYFINNKQISFVNITEKKLTISEKCLTKSKNYNCMAFLALKKVSLNGLDLKGGVNPGALVCLEKAHGEVVIGLTKDNQEISFCRFKDDSYIDNASLHYYAVKK